MTESDSSSPAILEAQGIVKRFGQVLALDHASFAVPPGIHALLGENGAGKSTLVKCLYGYYQPDEGAILMGGRKVDIRSCADARKLGIGLVFQQFTLIPALTVAENIALFLPDLPAYLDHRFLERRIRDTSERYGLPVDPSVRVAMLSLPEQQRVEILRVLLAGARILIFDEPTSSLPVQETETLFGVFRRLRDEGFPVVVITHKLPEVFEVAQTVTVMRHGIVAGTYPIQSVDEHRLVELMFGQETPVVCRMEGRPGAGTPVVALHSVTAIGQGRPLFDLNLEIHSGEIVGVAGVSGNGQSELADAICGMSRIPSGRRDLFGQNATGWSVRRIRDAGVGSISDSALGKGLIWSLSLEDNILLRSRRFSRFGGMALDRKAAGDELENRFAALGLSLTEGKRRAGTLSGGNAQRFALARELAEDPKVIVALYPTRGLDVPTASQVQKLLLEARGRGAGILLVSQDLNELAVLSDRLVVMRDAHIVGELPPDAGAYEIGRLMTGGTRQPAERTETREAVAV
jgi:general nucleoside transport system ATP-binding protein